jgi:hypothetical protein
VKATRKQCFEALLYVVVKIHHQRRVIISFKNKISIMNQDINNYEETTLASLKGLNNATEMQHARFTHNRPTVAEDLLPTLNRNQHQKSDKHKKDPSS